MVKILQWLVLVFGLAVLQSCAIAPPQSSPPAKPSSQPAEPAPPTTRPVKLEPQLPPAATTAPVDISAPTIPTQLPSEPQIIGGYPEYPSQPDPQSYPVVQQAPVIVSLLDQSDLYVSQGEPARAAASLERGLRIEPRNALLWSRLAQIRLQQQRYEQVESLAKKSNRFAQGDYALVSKNWNMIARARSSRGDANGAQAARRKAAEY